MSFFFKNIFNQTVIDGKFLSEQKKKKKTTKTVISIICIDFNSTLFFCRSFFSLQLKQN